MIESGIVITPELALVDRELAAFARARLPVRESEILNSARPEPSSEGSQALGTRDTSARPARLRRRRLRTRVLVISLGLNLLLGWMLVNADRTAGVSADSGAGASVAGQPTRAVSPLD